MDSVCKVDACSLTNTLSNGIYLANTNVILESSQLPAGKDFIFLINGTLTINGNISVPKGSTATFIVKEDIIVNRTAGEDIYTSSQPNIQGYYSTDKNFTVDGTNDCTIAPDKRLNIEGTVIANASRTDGRFKNNRTLCLKNRECQVITFAGRPDFLLNTPEVLQHGSSLWQEVAP